ncbi:putative outer membrane protein PmpB [bacterium HR24]|nr:putative outer membrane protein PmpB [bacterium HR24]
MSGSLLRKGIWTKLPLLFFLVAAVAGLALLGRSFEGARAASTVTINVNTTNDVAGTACPLAGTCSLRRAISQANGTTGQDVVINLPAGIFTITIAGAGENDNATGDFDVSLSDEITVTIQGQGPGVTVIDGDGLDRVLHVLDLEGGTLVIKNLTMRNGAVSGEGGGILNDDSSGGTVVLENVVIEANQALGDEDGGGIENYGDILIKGTVTVRNNVATDDGGGINNDGTITIANGATLVLEGNSADDEGGGINNDATLVFGDDDPSPGTATATLVARNNTAGTFGGGIQNDDTIERGFDGVFGVLVVTGNQAGDDGGGIENCCGTIGSSARPLSGSIANNTADGDGGGLFNDDEAYLAAMSITGNKASNGGGVWSGGTLLLARAAVANNELTDDDGNGGGILFDGDSLTLVNVTVVGNKAGSDDGSGGGLWLSASASLSLNFLTIANNQAGSDDNLAFGGGIYVDSLPAATTARGIILADNSAGAGGADCQNADPEGDDLTFLYSVVKGDTADTFGSNCILDATSVDESDPLLRPLGLYGGTVPTMAIPSTSPAVDRVPESVCDAFTAPVTDARGAVRNPTSTAGDALDGNLDGTRGCDAGAFESTPVDIAIAKADAPDPAFSGGSLTYTLTVTVADTPASDPRWATGVVVSDTLPAGTSFQSASVTPATAGSCSHSAGVVTCNFANIADGGTVTIAINVTVTAAGGTLTNTATVAMNEADTDPLSGDTTATAATAVAFGGAPDAPTLVAIWPGSSTQAMITWQPPSGVVTFYRLQSSLNFEFTFGVTSTDIPVGSLPFPGNIIGVGLPTADGLTFYYRLAACNSLGCSPFVFAGALAARQFPAGSTTDWNFVMGAFEFAGTVFAWGQNQVSVPGKNSDFNFYDGIQGFGGVLKASCNTVAPGSSCTRSWAAGNPFVSVAQEFPPFGQVGVAVRTH